MKRDRRTIDQFIAEQASDDLTFNAFGTPESIMWDNLPKELRFNFAPEQGAILLRIMDRAARMDKDMYMQIYLRFQNATEYDPSKMSLTFEKGEIIKILRAIKLTNDGIIDTGLNLRDAAWALRRFILGLGGIKETE